MILISDLESKAALWSRSLGSLADPPRSSSKRSFVWSKNCFGRSEVANSFRLCRKFDFGGDNRRRIGDTICRQPIFFLNWRCHLRAKSSSTFLGWRPTTDLSREEAEWQTIQKIGSTKTFSKSTIFRSDIDAFLKANNLLLSSPYLGAEKCQERIFYFFHNINLLEVAKLWTESDTECESSQHKSSTVYSFRVKKKREREWGFVVEQKRGKLVLLM